MLSLKKIWIYCLALLPGSRYPEIEFHGDPVHKGLLAVQAANYHGCLKTYCLDDATTAFWKAHGFSSRAHVAMDTQHVQSVDFLAARPRAAKQINRMISLWLPQLIKTVEEAPVLSASDYVLVDARHVLTSIIEFSLSLKRDVNTELYILDSELLSNAEQFRSLLVPKYINSTSLRVNVFAVVVELSYLRCRPSDHKKAGCDIEGVMNENVTMAELGSLGDHACWVHEYRATLGMSRAAYGDLGSALDGMVSKAFYELRTEDPIAAAKLLEKHDQNGRRGWQTLRQVVRLQKSQDPGMAEHARLYDKIRSKIRGWEMAAWNYVPFRLWARKRIENQAVVFQQMLDIDLLARPGDRRTGFKTMAWTFKAAENSICHALLKYGLYGAPTKQEQAEIDEKCLVPSLLPGTQVNLEKRWRSSQSGKMESIYGQSWTEKSKALQKKLMEFLWRSFGW